MSRSSIARAQEWASEERESSWADLDDERIFTWVTLLSSTWLVIGGFLDARHHLGAASVAENVFTASPHIVVYTAVAAYTTFIGIAIKNRRRSRWKWGVPPGYELSIVGCVLLAVGGVFDQAVWHRMFHLEVHAPEAGVSPTHLAVLAGGLMIIGGPLRASWRSGSRRISFAGMASITLTLAALTFTAEYAHPLLTRAAANPPPSGFVIFPNALAPYSRGHGQIFLPQALGVTGLILQGALITGLVLFLIRRFKLFTGSLLMLFGVTASLLEIVKPGGVTFLIPFTTGLILEGLLWAINPTPRRSIRFRVFAVSIPVVMYLTYFLGLKLDQGIWWSTPLWTGAIGIATGAALFISYLVLPPPSPTIHD